MDELRIDEILVNDCLRLLTFDENFQHRGLRHLVEMLAMAGYRHRSEYKVVLYNDNAEADFDDAYAHYLDLKAQGKDVEWDTLKGCLKE
jgi:hypothetical protein|tara:strand:+ start:227 stop:493 length:267 start_codon:yes stop_codon:yes gene_type:complete